MPGALERRVAVVDSGDEVVDGQGVAEDRWWYPAAAAQAALIGGSADDLGVPGGRDLHGLLEQAVEEQAGVFGVRRWKRKVNSSR